MLGSLLLPEDVVIVPVSRLAPGMRDRMEHEDGDHCVTRPRSRTTTTVVDARTAALLERFRTPSTIVDAVVAFCSAEGSDPRATLDDAFPVLAGFVREGLLLAAESELARPITGAFTPGDRVGPYEIVRPVHVVIDTEVYEARDPGGAAVALKIARAGAAAAPAHPMAAVLAHEARILRHLDGKVSPALLEQGSSRDGRSWPSRGARASTSTRRPPNSANWTPRRAAPPTPAWRSGSSTRTAVCTGGTCSTETSIPATSGWPPTAPSPSSTSASPSGPPRRVAGAAESTSSSNPRSPAPASRGCRPHRRRSPESSTPSARSPTCC